MNSETSHFSCLDPQLPSRKSPSISRASSLPRHPANLAADSVEAVEEEAHQEALQEEEASEETEVSEEAVAVVDSEAVEVEATRDETNTLIRNNSF